MTKRKFNVYDRTIDVSAVDGYSPAKKYLPVRESLPYLGLKRNDPEGNNILFQEGLKAFKKLTAAQEKLANQTGLKVCKSYGEYFKYHHLVVISEEIIELPESIDGYPILQEKNVSDLGKKIHRPC